MQRLTIKEVRKTLIEADETLEHLWEVYMKVRDEYPANHPNVRDLITKIDQTKRGIAALKEEYPRWEYKPRKKDHLVYPAFK